MITWLADYSLEDHQGGAQQTNDIMIRAGLLSGHDIKLMTSKEYSTNNLSDFVIINNINCFKKEFIKKIAKKPFAVYCHDYGLKHQPDLHYLFQQSKLNIFLSPLHRTQYAFVQNNIHLQPSPIEGFGFDNQPRQARIIWVGQIHGSKGINNIINFASTQSLPVHFYGFGDQGLIDLIKQSKNCHFMGQINHKELRKILNTSTHFIHMPNWHEPFGRTVMEAYLSGCHIIHNDQIGAFSYQWDWNNYDAIVEENKKSVDKFWTAIEKVIN